MNFQYSNAQVSVDKSVGTSLLIAIDPVMFRFFYTRATSGGEIFKFINVVLNSEKMKMGLSCFFPYQIHFSGHISRKRF